jgi:hypothetical protein
MAISSKLWIVFVRDSDPARIVPSNPDPVEAGITFVPRINFVQLSLPSKDLAEGSCIWCQKSLLKVPAFGGRAERKRMTLHHPMEDSQPKTKNGSMKPDLQEQRDNAYDKNYEASPPINLARMSDAKSSKIREPNSLGHNMTAAAVECLLYSLFFWMLDGQ